MAIEPSISKRALAAFGPVAKAQDATPLDSSIHSVEAGQSEPIAQAVEDGSKALER